MIDCILVFITNISIVLISGIILYVFGLHIQQIYLFMGLYAIFLFFKSIKSLFSSKDDSLKSVNGKIITVPRNTVEKRLIEAVNRQSQLVGIKAPQIAIYSSPTINAFASGYQKNDSLIALSSGLLATMTLGEVEAVIAHEITHINNGDVVTMTLLQSVVNISIIFITQMFMNYFIKFFNLDEKNSYKNFSIKQSLLNFGLRSILKYTIAICACLITMWFSRKREFYADAGAAKIVGSKKTIAALIQLKKNCYPQEPDSIITLCINGKKNQSLSILLSHPPIDSRIEAIKKRKYI